jgi:nucleotide-binding universal stress UspA family protein
MSGRIERIVVPFDATSETRVAIALAARLAAHGNAQLHVSLLRTRICCRSPSSSGCSI